MHSHSAETQTVTTLGNLCRGLRECGGNGVVPIYNYVPCGLKSHLLRDTMPRTGGLNRSAKCKAGPYLPTLCLAWLDPPLSRQAGVPSLLGRVMGVRSQTQRSPLFSKDRTGKALGAEASGWTEDKKKLLVVA